MMWTRVYENFVAGLANVAPAIGAAAPVVFVALFFGWLVSRSKK